MPTLELLEPIQESLDAIKGHDPAAGLYLLAEAAINDDVRSFAEEAPFDSRLYWDQMGRQHASISPYLLPWQSWDDFAEDIGFQPSWGIFIELKNEYAQWPVERQSQLLMAHLREWSLIEDQSEPGETTLLRISDWLVLQRLLSASSDEQQLALFGPVARFGYWPPQSETMQWLSCPQGQTSEAIEHHFPQRLSPFQWQALAQINDRYYQQRYCEHLRAYHQNVADWDDEKLASFVEEQVVQANEHGFTSELDIVRYLSLTLALGVNFIQRPWAQTIMQERMYEGTQSRMDRLMNKALEQLDEDREQA